MAGAQRGSSFAAGVKGSLRKAVEPPLKVLLISIFPSDKGRWGDVGDDCFEAEGGADSLLTNAELTSGAVSSILQDSDLKKVEALCVEEAMALSLKGTVSVCLSAFFYSSCCCVNVIC